MLSWLRKKQVSEQDAEVLNYALGLAAGYFLPSIQGQLQERFPDLSRRQVEDIARTCKRITKYGIDEVYKLVMKKGTSLKLEDLKPRMVARYEWISDDNIRRIIHTGIYITQK